MRKLMLGLLLLPVLAAACGGGDSRELHVFTWSDYISPAVVERFEQENDCRVVFDYFDSNEAMYAKLKAGATGYDVVVPSSYMVRIMAEQDMLLELDHSRLPNLRNIDSRYLPFAASADMKYSVPYMVGTTGIGYLRSKVPDFEPTWGIFARAEYARRMTLLNDMREALGAALKYLGYSLNTTNPDEVAAAGQLLREWKKNIAKFESDQYKNGLVSEEFVLAQGYSGDIMQVMAENPDIAYVLPREGTSIYVDELAILRNAPNPDLAHRFLDFLHRPEIAAQNTEAVFFLCPNQAAYPLLSEEIKANPAIFIPADVLERCEVIRDLGEANQLYSKVWDEVKAAP
ncbi:MAG: extracellular solute-binding protein [Acidobacteriota bacterium]